MTMKPLASATYAGKPSPNGRAAFAARSSGYVPIRTTPVAFRPADQAKPTVPARASIAHSPTAVPRARRSSVRRDSPAVTASRLARMAGPAMVVLGTGS